MEIDNCSINDEVFLGKKHDWKSAPFLPKDTVDPVINIQNDRISNNELGGSLKDMVLEGVAFVLSGKIFKVCF